MKARYCFLIILSIVSRSVTALPAASSSSVLADQAAPLPSHPAMLALDPVMDWTAFLGLPAKQALMAPGVYSLNVAPHPLITGYMERYTTPQGLAWLKETMDRGEPFRRFIVSAIEERDMPPELLFLPIVESEFRSWAVSVSGAAGMWQFMTNSIYPSFMKINEWLDDRRDFWKATEAALHKLLYNYRIMGDWLLAIAAYNCGLNRMKAIVETAGTKDFWELADKGYLPAETRLYVPKFLAVSAILSYPGRHGIRPAWDEGVLWDRLKLDFPVDLTLLAKEAGLPFDLLKSANAELNYAITPPVTPYYLKVPAKHTAAVSHILSQDRFKLMKFYVHSINGGDTLYDLGKHFGVGVDMILSYNPGIRPEALKIGARLLVPSVKEVGPYPGRQPAVKAPAAAPLGDFTGEFTGAYVVRQGDTLWSISKRFGTSPDRLAAENRMALSGVLSIGQKLSVPEGRRE